eukprot:1213443-Amphidinium_carterae.2
MAFRTDAWVLTSLAGLGRRRLRVCALDCVTWWTVQMCQSFAANLAKTLDVTIFWHRLLSLPRFNAGSNAEIHCDQHAT